MAGGVITTGSHPKLLWPGVHDTWGQVYDAHEKEYPDLYDEEDADQAYIQDVQITGFSMAPIKPQGQQLSYDAEVQGPVTTYTPIAYALGYIVTYEELRDNLYEIVAKRRAEANAFSINTTIETVCAFLYNNAFSSTYFTTADGVALISPSHTNTTGGTYSNELVPSADLSETALEDLCTMIMQVQNDTGEPIKLMQQSLHIPPQEWWNANRILKSVLQSDTANNNINVLKATNAIPKGIKLNHYFTSPSYWFLRTNCPRGMQMFWRDRPMFDKDNDFGTKNALAATYMRFVVGCTDPRGLFGSQ